MLAWQADALFSRFASFIRRDMLHLFTLGELRLETDDGRVISRRRKPLVLLAYLARRAPKSAQRSELATLLWGQRPDAKARQSLRQALLELKQLVGGRIEIGAETVHIETDVVELDVAAFERDIASGHDHDAIERWVGPFLGGAEDAGEMALELWLNTERAGLHRRLTVAFERLLDEAGRRGARHEVTAIARRWTDASPLDERACTHLIMALRGDGQVIDALACHASFVSRVNAELNTQPSRSFLALAQSLSESIRTERRNTRVAPEADVVTSFVGHESAFSTLTSAWQDSRDGHAVVVIIEAERGMGATRLCDEFARWVRTEDSTALVLRSPPVIGTELPVQYGYAASVLAPLCTAPALGGLAATTLASLAELLPQLRERFTHVQAPTEPHTEQDLTAAVADALEGVSEDSPIVIIADRIAIADTASRALFQRLAARDQPASLYIIVAAPGDTTSDGGVIESLRSSAATRVIRLGPITAPDIDAMLVSVSHLSSDDRSRLATAILRDTGGIPAYAAWVIDVLAEERLLAAGTTGVDFTTALIDDHELPIPGRLRTMLESRVRDLDPDARRTLEAAAVYGVPLTGHDADTLTHITVPSSMNALDALVRSGLMCRTVSGACEIAPPIVARAIYALIPMLQREALHAAATAAVHGQTPRWRMSSARRARLSYHVQRSGAEMERRRLITRWRVGVAAVVAAAAIATAVTASYSSRKEPVTVREGMVAILPFEITGNAQLAFLRNGMVDLLCASLDGAAGLHTVDPRAVIAATAAAHVDAPLTPDDARRVVDRFGARYFVLGSIVARDGKLLINATLYDTRAGTRALARASATGDEPRLFALVDNLTAQLAVAQDADAGRRLTQLAAITTTSLDALKAYLEGRAAYRSNDLLAALPAFERAVTADSTFALAWYGLATTASWMLRPGVEQHAAANALKHEARLSMRDRTLVEAFAAYSRGAADTAEQLTSSIVDSYQDDIEAWALLGEILYHHNWKRGRSLAESRRAWERVLSLDPNYWPALQHLSEVAALQGNRSELDSLLDRYQRSVGIEHVPITSLALRAYNTTGTGSAGATASREAIAQRVATDRGFWLTTSIWYVAVDAQNIDGARRLALFLVDPVRPPEQQGFGRILLAHLALAQGKWREARAQLEIARAHSPNDALEYQLLLSMAPFLDTPGAELRRQRSALVQLPVTASDVANTMPWPYRFNGMHELIRPYVAGLASARDGDDVSRREALSELSKMNDSMKLSHGFTASIRAEHLRATQQPSAALLELERGRLATPFVPAWTSAFVSQAYERYTRAELLHQLGRDDEALRWYGTFGENSPYDLVYLAPALYRQAQIYDARGQKSEAVRRYAHFLRLWKDADPELQSMTNAASRRLAQLQ